ncbi:MAG: DUF2614 family zinc ribbon-containing protein [Clostridia bacterium]
MELVVILSNFIKIFMVILLTYFVYTKIINYRNNIYTTIFIITYSVINSTMYGILIHYLNPLNVIFIIYIVYAYVIDEVIIKSKSNYIAFLIAAIISYILYFISTLISGIILLVFIPRDNSFKNPISLILIPVISVSLLNYIFKIKRFKNGVNFLNSTKINRKTLIYTAFFTGVIILSFGLYQKTNNVMTNTCIFLGTVLIAISLIIWIKTQITKTYKSKMRDRTIEIQKTEIDEQTKLIEEIKAENLKLATAVHKYNSKFESLEHAMKRTLSLDSKTEFANEISVILKESEETLKNFAKEVEVNTNKLPLTNIHGIDKMFKYMQEEAAKDNINFDLKINESITPLIENIIPKEKFEILIGDHLKDAIIAIKASDATYKSILVTLGLVEGIYEFSIYDTGIEFEIDTLLKLGEEQVTTHKNEGGSGIGFMTTFETLKECKASLVIEEYNPETTNYTKSVTIKFDGKNEYKICSYRAEKIKEQKSKRRIIIEKMK